MALSLNPQHVKEHVWYYEEPDGIEIVYEIYRNGGFFRTDRIEIPWEMLKKSVKRLEDKR